MRCLLLLSIVMSTFMLSACYTTAPDPQHPRDPLQHLNRDTTRFNDKIDKAVLKPVAKGYKAITPYAFRRSVGNFFSNLGEVKNMGNDLLQGNIRWALSDFWRFVFNTTIGIGGLFDPASHIGLMPHSNDFGLTLNRWHLYSDYLVLPFLGPNTVGTTIALPVDYHLGISNNIFPVRTQIALFLLSSINRRAALLGREKTANGLMIDQYVFYENAYLQYRAHLLEINRAGPYFPGYDPVDESDAAETEAD